MNYIIEFTKIILPTLLKQHSKLLVQIFIFIIFTAINNLNAIEKYINEGDIATQSIHKAFKVETELEVLREEYGADEVCISILHNGTTASADPSFHLMKFTVLYSVGENSRIAKILYRDRPLNLWLKQLRNMMANGHYLMKDMRESKDPLVRRIGDKTGAITQLYLPLYSKDHYLLGFVVMSYNHKEDITKSRISNIRRSVLQVESLL